MWTARISDAHGGVPLGSPPAPRPAVPPPAAGRLPAGFRVRLASHVHVCDDGRTLLGGMPGHVLRLKPVAVGRLDGDGELVAGGGIDGPLARLLLDRGIADPVWREPPPSDQLVDDVTIVVPVRDRPRGVARLLAALPAGCPVVVVDDGSTDPASIAAAAAAAASGPLTVLRHRASRGPAAARNRGLSAVRTPFVAFCDSDVVPQEGWLGTLRRHLDDPAVAVVGPRVLGPVAAPDDSWIARYEQARSSLDLGPRPGVVRAGAAIGYLPSACLLARVDAVAGGFDEGMAVGEDVDLVWRLVAVGWRVRYEPVAIVRHEHRVTLREWAGRKAVYGTSAAALAARHEAAVAPMVLRPWTVALSVALLAQRWWSVPVGLAAGTLATARTARRLPPGERRLAPAAVLVAAGGVATTRQLAAALTRHYWPVTLGAMLLSRRARRAALVAAVAEGLTDYRRVSPRLGPGRFLLARQIDDLGYGAGVWWGAWRARSLRALLPATGQRSARVSGRRG